MPWSSAGVTAAPQAWGEHSGDALPVNGKRYDMHMLKESSLLDGIDPSAWRGDYGFEGSNMFIPLRKPYRRELEDWQRA